MFKPRKKEAGKKSSALDDPSNQSEESEVQPEVESLKPVTRDDENAATKSERAQDDGAGEGEGEGDVSEVEEVVSESVGEGAGKAAGTVEGTNSDPTAEEEPAAPAPPLEGIGWKVSASRDLSTALLDFGIVSEICGQIWARGACQVHDTRQFAWPQGF